jgi:hypothetical protein
MNVNRLLGIGHGRGRCGLSSQRDEEQGQPGDGCLGEIVLDRLREQSLGGLVGQPVLGCEGLDRFA